MPLDSTQGGCSYTVSFPAEAVVSPALKFQRTGATSATLSLGSVTAASAYQVVRTLVPSAPPTITSPAGDGAEITTSLLTVAGTTVVPNSTVQVTVGSVSPVATLSDASGNWTVELNIESLTGAQTISVTAKGPRQLPSPAATRTITVRRTATDIPQITSPAVHAAVSGLLTVTGTAEPGSTVTVTLGTRTATAPAAATDGAWSADFDVSALVGYALLSATAQASGKPPSAAGTRGIFVVPATPAPVITSPVANATVGSSLTVTGTAEVGAVVRVTLGTQGLAQTTEANRQGAWSVTFNTTSLGTAAVETVNLSATAHVSAYGVSAPVVRSITVDNHRPAITATTARVTVRDTVQVTLTVSEPVTGLTAADLLVSDQSVAEVVTLTGSGSSYTLTLAGLAVGTATVSLAENSFTDALGNPNQAGAAMVSLTVMPVPSEVPQVTLPDVITAEDSELSVTGTPGASVSVVVAHVPEGSG